MSPTSGGSRSRRGRERAAVALSSWLERQVAGGTLTDAALLVAVGERVLLRAGAGPHAGQQSGRSAVFDLASLTKPHVATLALRLDGAGELSLRTSIGAIAPEASPSLASLPLGALLRHRSGLRPWVPLYRLCDDRADAERQLLDGRWLGAAPGSYSDLGYLLWGVLAERALGVALDHLFRERLAGPLRSRACWSPEARPSVVPCDCDGAREAQLASDLGLDLVPPAPPDPGVVQDGNARWWRGAAAHAGLFGTIDDLHRLALAWSGAGLVSAQQRRAALAGRQRRVLGWERRRVRGPGGPSLDPGAFGHTGFTGGSLWLEPVGPRGGAVYVLLAHRRSALSDLGPLRRAFHRRAAALVEAERGGC